MLARLESGDFELRLLGASSKKDFILAISPSVACKPSLATFPHPDVLNITEAKNMLTITFLNIITSLSPW
jgi:hypothetical protein